MLSIHRTALSVAKEFTEGIENSSGTMILASNLEFTPLESEQFTSNPMAGKFSVYEHFHSGARSRVAFSVNLTPPATKGELPVYHDLLLACGYTYDQTDSDGDGNNDKTLYSLNYKITATLTIMVLLDRILHTFIGARGNVRFVANMHEPAVMLFEFIGLWKLPKTASPHSYDFSKFPKPLITDSNTTSLLVDNQALPARRFEIDTGNLIEYSETMDGATIALRNRQSKSDLTFSANTIDVTNPTHWILQDTTKNHELLIEYPAGQEVRLTVPHGQWLEHALSSENDQWFHRVSIGLQSSKSDDPPIRLEVI